MNKAIDRARRAKRAQERGGVVWRTQGSVKSLTTMWLALKLRRDEHHENPTLVLVTDRVDLDEQITKTFQACGFPNPTRAESVKALRGLLSGPGGGTILTTVHKFQEVAAKGSKRSESPSLSEAKNVFMLTDEAHRTQYGLLPETPHRRRGANRDLTFVVAASVSARLRSFAWSWRGALRHLRARCG